MTGTGTGISVFCVGQLSVSGSLVSAVNSRNNWTAILLAKQCFWTALLRVNGTKTIQSNVLFVKPQYPLKRANLDFVIRTEAVSKDLLQSTRKKIFVMWKHSIDPAQKPVLKRLQRLITEAESSGLVSFTTQRAQPQPATANQRHVDTYMKRTQVLHAGWMVPGYVWYNCQTPLS